VRCGLGWGRVGVISLELINGLFNSGRIRYNQKKEHLINYSNLTIFVLQPIKLFVFATI
jgi:hypothetical protein